MSKEIKLIDESCIGCVHRAYFDGGEYFCDYIGDEGHMRPCPAGKGCTEYEKGESNRMVRLSLHN